jgi:hypothetical protein
LFAKIGFAPDLPNQGSSDQLKWAEIFGSVSYDMIRNHFGTT